MELGEFVLADALIEIQDDSMLGMEPPISPSWFLNSGQPLNDEISDSQLLQAIEADPMLGAGPQLDQDERWT